MSSQNPWVVVQTFAEHIAPVAQQALEATAVVCAAVMAAESQLEQKGYLTPAERQMLGGGKD